MLSGALKASTLKPRFPNVLSTLFRAFFSPPQDPPESLEMLLPSVAARPVGLRACSCWFGELARRARGRLQRSETSKQPRTQTLTRTLSRGRLLIQLPADAYPCNYPQTFTSRIACKRLLTQLHAHACSHSYARRRVFVQLLADAYSHNYSHTLTRTTPINHTPSLQASRGLGGIREAKTIRRPKGRGVLNLFQNLQISEDV